MRISARMAGWVLAAGLAVMAAGCDTHKGRPDIDADMPGGLTAKDLRTMTDQMAPEVLKIAEVGGNSNRITIVVKGVRNGLEGQRTRDLDIYVMRLAGLLNQYGRDRVAFIEESRTLRQMQAEELGNPTGTAVDQKMVPQYFLYGEFNSMRGPKSTYFNCTFKLTNATSGVEVWSGMYDTSTWNH